MDSGVVTGIAAGFASIIAAGFAYRASSQANKTAATKVEGEAFDRSKGMYDQMLSNADKEMVRLQGQVDRLRDQLSQEQDLSNGLRTHIRTMQQQILAMETSLAQLHRDNGEKHP